MIRYYFYSAWASFLFRKKVYAHGPFTILGRKNIHVGQRLSLNHGAQIVARENVVLGDDVTLSTGCKIIDTGLSMDGLAQGDRDHKTAEIVLGNDVWVGANALILSGVTIGEGAVIAAGAVVTRDVPPFCLVAGVPAKVVRDFGIEKVPPSPCTKIPL